ncbi:MAG TPA: DUF222 domain-containing protein [Streptosporangiaceae bacterium]|nr:DUF222 domain-containing protein [Streptosporangiaceae bacterium]
MCLPGQPPAAPTTAAQAVAMARAGLAWLAAADATTLTGVEQAECLRGLERAEAVHTAARARVLAAFCAGNGYEDDGHGSAKTWLRWQTRVTPGAAAGALGWMRRLAHHPAVGAALAAGRISQSWARQVCEWSDLLPERHRSDADEIFLEAAGAGVDLAGLGELAEEMRRRLAPPDRDGDDFEDRRLRLETTFRGAGKLDGDLTPRCAAALQAVLDALGKKAGPEDIRTRGQRAHDALEEACRRLIGSARLPDRGGQPTQLVVHASLDQLRGLPGAAAAEAAWGAPAAPGDECDASVVPVVTGHVDPDILDRLVAALLSRGCAQAGSAGTVLPQDAATRRPERAEDHRRARAARAGRQSVIKAAADLLSGPGGMASYLRTRLAPDIAASVSLPLDVGAVTETIPAHLRRAVAIRDRHCRWPGCSQPIAACQPHHVIPRAHGGPTCLTNLLTLCSFHHLIAVHRWGWRIVLHPDGSVTVTSPDGYRSYHSHGPPTPAAAA